MNQPARCGEPDFWAYLDQLVATSRIVIEHPKGSADPGHLGDAYPASYGYLEGTRSMDGEGIDVWVGAGEAGPVQGVVCTVDLARRDSEVKILLGCSDDEIVRIVAFHTIGQMRGLLVRRRPGHEAGS